MKKYYENISKFVFIFIIMVFIISSILKTKRFLHSVLITLNIIDDKKFSYIDKFVKIKQSKVTYKYKGENIPVKIFKPDCGKKCPAVLVSHGLAPQGFKDWRLVKFAKTLAKTGIIVFLPNFELLKRVRIKMRTVYKMRFLFDKMIGEPFVDKSKAGFFAISYSGGPATIAFSKKEYKQKLKYIVYLGGYYNLFNVLVFGLSGHSSFNRYEYHTKPSDWGRWYYLISNIEYVESDKDKKLLKRIAEIKRTTPESNTQFFEKQLSEKGKQLLLMIKTQNPHRIRKLIKKQNPRLRKTLEIMSPEKYIAKLKKVKILLLHASNDPLIPFTESFRFRRALIKHGIPASLTIINALEHVNVIKKEFSFENVLTFYIPELVKMSNIVYEMINS